MKGVTISGKIWEKVDDFHKAEFMVDGKLYVLITKEHYSEMCER